MAKILLIRHAEPELPGVLLGRTDCPLSAAGRNDARRALSQLRPEVVWTSPLRRARETALAIPDACIRELAELREIDMGEWTGLSWAEVERRDDELARRKLADWFGVPSPGGESWPTFASRVKGAWNIIREGPSCAAVVGHRGVNAVLAYLIDGRDPAQFEQQYCEVVSLDY